LKQTPTFKSILVLCEGNHCRSPIAEALLRELLPPEIRVESAGLNALKGFPAHSEVLRIMADCGIDVTHHRGRQLTPPMAHASDLILVMDEQQKEFCGRMVPGARGRIYLLGHWVSSPPLEIADPLHKDHEAFHAAYEIIQRCVASWLPHMTINQRLA
jgi:protein-tyrosine phosphatase